MQLKPGYQQFMIEQTLFILSMLPCTKSHGLPDTDVVFMKDKKSNQSEDARDSGRLFSRRLHTPDLGPRCWASISLTRRYNQTILKIPTNCDGCGAAANFEHTLDCQKGDLVTQRHNESENRTLPGTVPATTSFITTQPEVFFLFQTWTQSCIPDLIKQIQNPCLII
ncbi:hypothetical protein EMCRGX_G011948 [Ephydatia muelleri]